MKNTRVPLSWLCIWRVFKKPLLWFMHQETLSLSFIHFLFNKRWNFINSAAVCITKAYTNSHRILQEANKDEIVSILYIFLSHQNGVAKESWTVLSHWLCPTLKASQVPFFISWRVSFFPQNRNWKNSKLPSIERYPCIKMPGATLISESTFKIIGCFDDWQSLYKWQPTHKKNEGRSTRTMSLKDLQKELVKLATLPGNCADWEEREMVLDRQEEAISHAQKENLGEFITFLVDCSRCCFLSQGTLLTG